MRARAAPARPWRRAALSAYGLWGLVRPIIVALVSGVVFLLLLDSAVFDSPLLLPRLPTYRHDNSPNDKLLQAARYANAQVLFLGDSRIVYGVDPEVVSKRCGCGPGYNAGFPGAEIRTTRIMAERLLEKLSPRLVVIGVSQWELSDQADVSIGEGVRELAPPWRRAEFGLGADLPELVGGVWRLYKYRGELRQALDVWVGEGEPAEPRRGYSPYSGRPELRDRDFDRREAQWFTDFSVEGRRSEALKGLIADLRRRGIRVVLLVPPLHPEFQDDVRAEIGVFRAAIAKLAEEQGVMLIDATRPRDVNLDDDHFRDVVHLDEDGSEKLSRYIGEKLRSGR